MATPSLRPAEKAKSYLTLIGVGLSLVASLYAGSKTIWSGVSSVITKDQLIEHNLAKESHPPLKDSFDSCHNQSELALKRVEEIREDQIMTMARLARLVAADMERDPRKKAARATLAEIAFKRNIRRGESLEDAFVAAINELD